MCTCASTLVPRSSSNPPTRPKMSRTWAGFRAAAAWAAASSDAPVWPAFWCSTNTAKISPNSMPPTISATPPKTSSRCALMGANEAEGNAVVAIPEAMCEWRALIGCGLRGVLAECGHHMFGEQILRLDALPVFQPAEVGDHGEFADPTLGLQFANLADNLVGRADKTDFLFNDLLVTE